MHADLGLSIEAYTRSTLPHIEKIVLFDNHGYPDVSGETYVA